MNHNSAISVLCILLLGLTITNVSADQPGSLNNDSTPQTVTIGGVAYPAFPEGYDELLDKIDNLESQIQQLKNDEIPAASTEQIVAKRKQIEEKIRVAKKELDSLANEKYRVEKSIRENWSSLPQDLQNALIAKIKENPNLKVYDVKDLCPDNMSYMDFAKIVQEGKALSAPYQKWNTKRIEYNRLVETLNAFDNSIREKRENDIKNRDAQIKKLEEELILAEKELKEKQTIYFIQMFFRIVSNVLSKHPDYNKVNAEFPFDDLIVPLSELKTELENLKTSGESDQIYTDPQDEKSIEKLLFNVAEYLWNKSRPCLLNSEPARVALHFWTAYVRGDYDEAQKYANDFWTKIIEESRLDPQKRILPINPNYQGMVILIEKEEPPKDSDKTSENSVNQESYFVFVIPYDNRPVVDLAAIFLVETRRNQNENKDENQNEKPVEGSDKKPLLEVFPLKMVKENGEWKAHFFIEK